MFKPCTARLRVEKALKQAKLRTLALSSQAWTAPDLSSGIVHPLMACTCLNRGRWYANSSSKLHDRLDNGTHAPACPLPYHNTSVFRDIITASNTQLLCTFRLLYYIWLYMRPMEALVSSSTGRGYSTVYRFQCTAAWRPNEQFYITQQAIITSQFTDRGSTMLTC